jgi:ribokinase
VAVIVVTQEAQNTILVVPGANAELTAEDIRRAEAVLRQAQVVMAQFEVPQGTVLEAFRIAKAGGAQTILNPAPAQIIPEQLLALTDICVPNASELEELSGEALLNPEDMRRAGRRLLARGPARVVVTLGADGALLLAESHEQHYPAERVEAVDPTGAGDAFLGSLAVFLAQGQPLVDAVRLANKVAALSVTRPGAQASFPTREEFHSVACSRQPEYPI